MGFLRRGPAGTDRIGVPELERVAYPRRHAPGVPHLDQVRVAGSGVYLLEDPLRYSEFQMGATVQVVSFPGDPDISEWRFEQHPRPAPRPRRGPGYRVPAPPPQTVSNARRAELAELYEVPPAELDILEGVG